MLSSEERKLRAGYSLIPFCSLARVEECIDRLREAGVSGGLEIVKLPPERAYLGGAAGRVTTTDPPAGALLAPGEAVTVYVNPGQAAELSDRDLTVIASLKAEQAVTVAAREQIFRDSLVPSPNLAERPAVSTTLDIGLLEQLDARLRDGHALIADAWAPGLTDAQIDGLLLPAGITLPEEARVWWRWHNGTRSDAPAHAHSLAWREPYSLAYAVEQYESFRAMFVEWWRVDGLLCPIGEQPRIYFDCTGAADEPVAIYVQNDDTESPQIALGSIGELVLAMLEYFNCRAWTIDQDGAVRGEPERAPAAIAFR